MTLRTLPLVLLFAIPVAGQDAKGEWVPLFNGKNLDGWTPKVTGHALGENFADTFRVEDGLLKVRYDKYKAFDGQFGHLFFKDKYSHYIARIEYRFVGDQCPGGPGWAVRNSGLMFHCQDPKTMRKDQEFPVSIEAQFLGGAATGERSTNNLCTPGTNVVIGKELVTRHCTNSKSKTYRGDGWVTVEIEVHGAGKVTHRVEGQTVLEYKQAQYDQRDADGAKLIVDKKLLIEEGYLSLQAESHPVDFRKVEIKVLKK